MNHVESPSLTMGTNTLHSVKVPKSNTNFRDIFFLKNAHFFQKWGDGSLSNKNYKSNLNTKQHMMSLILIDTHEGYEKAQIMGVY